MPTRRRSKRRRSNTNNNNTTQFAEAFGAPKETERAAISARDSAAAAEGQAAAAAERQEQIFRCTRYTTGKVRWEPADSHVCAPRAIIGPHAAQIMLEA